MYLRLSYLSLALVDLTSKPVNTSEIRMIGPQYAYIS